MEKVDSTFMIAHSLTSCQKTCSSYSSHWFRQYKIHKETLQGDRNSWKKNHLKNNQGMFQQLSVIKSVFHNEVMTTNSRQTNSVYWSTDSSYKKRQAGLFISRAGNTNNQNVLLTTWVHVCLLYKYNNK